MAVMAAWASWLEPISTKPKPFERPVSRSMMTWADCTVPCGANIASRSASVTPYARLPTYNFAATRASCEKTSRNTHSTHTEQLASHEKTFVRDELKASGG